MPLNVFGLCVAYRLDTQFGVDQVERYFVITVGKARLEATVIVPTSAIQTRLSFLPSTAQPRWKFDSSPKSVCGSVDVPL